MPSLPNGWRVVQQKPDRDPEAELATLKSRLGAITRRFDRADALRRYRRYRRKAKNIAFTILMIAVGLATPFVLMKLFTPWPLHDHDPAYRLGPQLRRRPRVWSRSRAKRPAWLLANARRRQRWHRLRCVLILDRESSHPEPSLRFPRRDASSR
jgi:hypothetical protein